jgi:hypothetical protein
MTQRTKDFLKPLFNDGERPSGADFGDLIDSFVNNQTDVLFDNDGNLVLNRGVRLGDSAGTVAGGLRFNNNQLQVFTGGAWVNVASGGGGSFQAPPTTPPTPVVHDGNVGIGSFAAAPTFRLEVPLGTTGTAADQVRFGSVVCSNGTAASGGYAVISHQNQAALSVDNNFALRQSPNGAVHINAPAGQVISFRQDGGTIVLGVSAAGHVVVGREADLPGAGGAAFQVAGSAFKNDGSGAWTFTSDARVKEDVQDLELGLAELRQVRPVRFRYNGRAGTTAGQAGVGVLGQEIETIVPETIRRVSVTDEPELDDMRVFDPSALTYVLINAVKELAARVEHLEQALAAQQPKRSPGRSSREA